MLEGDSAKEELTLVRKKLDLTEQKLIGTEAIILNLNRQLDNLKLVNSTREEQLVEYQSLSTKLEGDLKKERIQKRIYQSTVGTSLILFLLLGVV